MPEDDIEGLVEAADSNNNDEAKRHVIALGNIALAGLLALPRIASALEKLAHDAEPA